MASLTNDVYSEASSVKRQEQVPMSVVFAGHVDHGKSTLIGRVLFDTKSIPQDRIDEVKKICAELGREFEFCFLLDYLEEEREQNVTIDISETRFSTAKRDYLIIDAPGHREFTKNMITGSSRAQAAILLVDVNEGVCEQTRRHAFILGMLGISKIIVAVNKMDLCGYSQERFLQVVDSVKSMLASRGMVAIQFVPICARDSENIMSPTSKMPWYNGPALIPALDSIELPSQNVGSFTFPVQDVYRVADDRIFVGMVASGSVQIGDAVWALPSKQPSVIKKVVEFLNPNRVNAVAGESVGITLGDRLFIERGVVLAGNVDCVRTTSVFDATLFWLSDQPVALNESLTFRCATQECPCFIETIHERLDSSTMDVLGKNAPQLMQNDVARVTIRCKSDVVLGDFTLNPTLGRFVLERDLNTSAGGIVLRDELTRC